MNHKSPTVGDNHYNRVWYLLYVAYKGYWHNFVDRPKGLLRQQSAIHPSIMLYETSAVSLLACLLRPVLLVAGRITALCSPLACHTNSLVRVLTCFVFFPTDFQRRDCLQSMISEANGNMTLHPQGFWILWLLGMCSPKLKIWFFSRYGHNYIEYQILVQVIDRVGKIKDFGHK